MLMRADFSARYFTGRDVCYPSYEQNGQEIFGYRRTVTEAAGDGTRRLYGAGYQ